MGGEAYDYGNYWVENQDVHCTGICCCSESRLGKAVIALLLLTSLIWTSVNLHVGFWTAASIEFDAR